MKKFLRLGKFRYLFSSFLIFFILPSQTQAQGDLGIILHGPDQALPGATIEYTLMITNRGPGDMTNIAVQMPAVTNFTATSVSSCISGMANNGSSACPLAGELTIANLQGAGIIVPSIPDGGTVTITVSGTTATVANYTSFTISATVSATGGQTDLETGNNSNSYTTTIHDLAGGQISVYKFNAVNSADISPPVGANGGSFVLEFFLFSGPPVPGIGNGFTIPCSYSGITNRTGNGVNYVWTYRGALDNDYDSVFSLVPDGDLLFTNLPAANNAEHLSSIDLFGDNYYRLNLSTNAIEPLGVFDITVGPIPELSPLSTSILQYSSVTLYGSFSSSRINSGDNEVDYWSNFVAPLTQPLGDEPSPNTALQQVPYNNTYPFRFSAVLHPTTSAPDDFMTGGLEWANLYHGEIRYWTPNETLPVTWNHFTVAASNDKALLKWSTASEQNNKGFEVERSADGKNWTVIGFVASKSNQGNSSTALEYEAPDNQPLNGINYYRLKQLDIDGRYVYSSVKTISFNLDNKIIVLPNPANNFITIKGLAGNETIRIHDAAGKTVSNLKVTGSVVTISLTHLPKGLYHITVNTGGKMETRTIIKQ